MTPNKAEFNLHIKLLKKLKCTQNTNFQQLTRNKRKISTGTAELVPLLILRSGTNTERAQNTEYIPYLDPLPVKDLMEAGPNTCLLPARSHQFSSIHTSVFIHAHQWAI